METMRSVLETQIGSEWQVQRPKLDEFLLAHDDDGYTALHRAVYSGHLPAAEVCESLLS